MQRGVRYRPNHSWIHVVLKFYFVLTGFTDKLILSCNHKYHLLVRFL